MNYRYIERKEEEGRVKTYEECSPGTTEVKEISRVSELGRNQ